MVSLNRNHNLEEINADGFLGIDMMKNQTVAQKVVLFGAVAIGMGINIFGNMLWGLDMMTTVILTLIPIVIGALFGLNYDEDLTLLGYIKISLFQDSVVYYSQSTEDLEVIRKSAEQIKEKERLEAERLENPDQEHRAMLIKMVSIIAIVAVVVIIFLFVSKGTQTQELHHTVSNFTDMNIVSLHGEKIGNV